MTGNTDQFVGIGETNPTLKASSVKGDGTAHPLIVRNGAGFEVLSINNSGTVFLGTGTDVTSLFHLKAGGQTLINGSSSGTLHKRHGHNRCNNSITRTEYARGRQLMRVRDDNNVYKYFFKVKNQWGRIPKYVVKH